MLKKQSLAILSIAFEINSAKDFPVYPFNHRKKVVEGYLRKHEISRITTREF